MHSQYLWNTKDASTMGEGGGEQCYFFIAIVENCDAVENNRPDK